MYGNLRVRLTLTGKVATLLLIYTRYNLKQEIRRILSTFYQYMGLRVKNFNLAKIVFKLVLTIQTEPILQTK